MAVAWKRSAAAVTLMAQLNARFPKRDTSSDGSIGDAAHRTRQSDHNPNVRGFVLAQDIDEDFGRAGDARKFADQLAAYAASGKPGADRIKNIVYEDQVASGTYRKWFWIFRGSGYEHRHHIHVSFTEKAEKDGQPFPLPILKLPTK